MEISISIVDYIGKIKDGVATIFSININDTIYQMIFWFDGHKKYVLTVDESLLNLLSIKSIYEYEHLDDFLIKIFQTLPPVKDLFEKFNIDYDT